MSAPDLEKKAREAAIAWAIATLTDLHLRPEDGGPFFVVRTGLLTGEIERRAVQPRDIEGVFAAMRKALGDYARMDAWIKQTRAEAFKAGQEQTVERICDTIGAHECSPSVEECHCVRAIIRAVRALPIADEDKR